MTGWRDKTVAANRGIPIEQTLLFVLFFIFDLMEYIGMAASGTGTGNGMSESFNLIWLLPQKRRRLSTIKLSFRFSPAQAGRDRLPPSAFAREAFYGRFTFCTFAETKWRHPNPGQTSELRSRRCPLLVHFYCNNSRCCCCRLLDHHKVHSIVCGLFGFAGSS